MTSTLLKISSLLLISLSLLGGIPFHAQAQKAVTFTVSPTIFDMTATPGQTWESTVRIINANPFELKIYVDVVNFVPKGETGTPKFLPVDQNTEPNGTLAQWIETTREITVAPERTIELPLKISLPTTAAPGGHFAAIMISTRPPENDADQTIVQTSQVISSLVFLRVTGDISENSTIRSFRTTHYLLSKPEATFELRIENKGNVHVQPQGEIRILNMWGQERGSIPVNQQTLFGNVLPNSVRKYSFTWNSEWSVTDIGRYTAIATLAYGTNGRQSIMADTAFWIIPWKILLLVFSIVGGFVTLVTWGIKLYVRRMLKLAGVTPGSHRVQVSAIEQIAIATNNKGRKKISIVAPIEAGILDLRARLSKTDTVKMYTQTIISFVRLYWKFFTVISVLIIFIILVILFLKGAFTPSRDFEVTIEGDGQSVTVTGEDTIVEPVEPVGGENNQATTSAVLINIVNRSGIEALTSRVQQSLQTSGYVVNRVENDFNVIEENTVIVYDPSLADDALVISEIMHGAPLSSYAAREGEHPEVVIYIGSDANQD